MTEASKSTTRRAAPQIAAPGTEATITTAVAALIPLLAALGRKINELDDLCVTVPAKSPEYRRASCGMAQFTEACDALQDTVMRLPAATLTDALALVTLAASNANGLASGGWGKRRARVRAAIIEAALASARFVIEREAGITARALGLGCYLVADETEGAQ